MGKVYSFEYWKEYGERFEITKPCKPPVHRASNIDTDLDWCVRCREYVFWNTHPSMKKPKWYSVT